MAGLLDGALAQLGERLICIQEVRSSILLGSTIPRLRRNLVLPWFLRPPIVKSTGAGATLSRLDRRALLQCFAVQSDMRVLRDAVLTSFREKSTTCLVAWSDRRPPWVFGSAEKEQRCPSQVQLTRSVREDRPNVSADRHRRKRDSLLLIGRRGLCAMQRMKAVFLFLDQIKREKGVW